MTQYRHTSLPGLPLLLWATPPGLEIALFQEGIAYRHVHNPHPLAFRGGRFVLFDSKRVPASTVRARLSPEHVAVDIDRCRHGEPLDPFRALIDHHAGLARWDVNGFGLTERVSRRPKAAIRARIIEQIRQAVSAAGGLWARLAPFPFPYRSAFNFRADLDESLAEDYARFARARRPLNDCCTHFVSTHAYGKEAAVLQDLHRFDSQSHGHYHVIYRDPAANHRNLARAHRLLCDAGIEPVGFAAPHGRWNPDLDGVMEDLGYRYSSDFQLGYDDLPFFPWLSAERRFSRVLQVPIHPVCEGLFFEAGALDGRFVADHLVRTVRARIEAGEPAFVYGHPERRLGRHPEVLAALAETISADPLLWRTTLTDFARWWRWRSERRWSLLERAEGRYEIQFDDWRRPIIRLLWRSCEGNMSRRFRSTVRVLRCAWKTSPTSGREILHDLPSPDSDLAAKRPPHRSPQGARLGNGDAGRGTPRIDADRPRQERPPLVAPGSHAMSTLVSSSPLNREPPTGLDSTAWLTVRSRGSMSRGAVLLHAPSHVFQSPGGGENQLVRTGMNLERLGIPVRPFSPWTDRLEGARLLHVFGMSREGLELARVARARGLPVALSPICWYDPRSLAALAGGPIAAARDLTKWAVLRALPRWPTWRRALAGHG